MVKRQYHPVSWHTPQLLKLFTDPWWLQELLISSWGIIRWRISLIPSRSRNLCCFCLGSTFVRPSAGISAVGIQSTCMRPALTSCFIQSRFISTCRSFVCIVAPSFVNRSTVCWLSHAIDMGWEALNPKDSRTRCHHRTVFPASERANSSASVVDVVTVFCFEAFQSMGPP